MASVPNRASTSYSRGNHNQLSRKVTGKTTCLKCGEAGNVLVCSGDDCPIIVHESCMSCPAEFDDTGNFCCPYCLYKMSLRGCHQAKRRALLARNALSSFLDTSTLADIQGKLSAEGEKSRFPSVEQDSTCMKEMKDGRGSTHPVQVDKDDQELACAPKVNQRISRDELVKKIMADKQEKDLGTSYNDSGKLADQCETVMISTENQIHLDCRNIGNLSCKEAYGTTRENLEVVVTTNQPDEGNVAEIDSDRVSRGCEKSNLKSYGQDDHPESVDAGTDQQQRLPVHFCQVEMEKNATSILHELETVKNIRKTAKEGQNEREDQEQITQKPTETDGCPTRNECVADMQEASLNAEESSTSSQNDYVIRARTPTKQRSQDSKNCRDVDLSRRPQMNNVGVHVHKTDQAVISSKLRPGGELFKVDHKSLALLNNKRTKLAWTVEEEEMLKEGVEKFSTTVNKNIPWRKILDFGRHVFDGTRTPVDLKDKWKNLTAKKRA